MSTLTRLFVVCGLLAARPLAGQEPTDSLSRLQVDATTLRPARYSYNIALTREGLAEDLGTQTISFASTNYAGTPSWLILEGRTGVGINGLDSLVATRDGLNALHWGTSNGLARLVAAFTRDSVYGATSSPLGRRSLVGPAPRGVIASEGMLDGLMQLAPIGEGWTASATLLVADLTGTRLVAARIAVEREEQVTVPAGTFSSWVVSVRTGNADKFLWVSKEDRMVVKTSQALSQLNGALLDRVLTRVDNLKLLPSPPAVPLPNDPPTVRQQAPSR